MVRFLTAATLMAAMLSVPAAMARCLNPDDSIPSNARMIEAGEPCLKKSADEILRVHELTQQERVAVAESVTDTLKDPESARFKWLPMRTAEGHYCAFFNAKNSFGGYVGFRLFHAYISRTNGRPVSSLVSVADDDEMSRGSYLTSEACTKAGYLAGD